MKTAFFCVDAQFDFMDPRGKLFVPGSESIQQVVRELTSFAMEHYIPVVASRDWHREGDTEFHQNQFPPHCIAGTPGAELIPQAFEVRGEAGDHRVVPDVLISKNTFDVFSNPNTAKVVKAIKSHQWVVYGVATDYCVKAVAIGLRKLKRKVFVITDAIRGVNEDTTKVAFCEMKTAGAKLLTYNEVFPLL